MKEEYFGCCPHCDRIEFSSEDEFSEHVSWCDSGFDDECMYLEEEE
jgi:hypothetical protein